MDQLRMALRRLAKAVVVVTTAGEGARFAMAATAVSELSMDPPSMLICVNSSASIHEPLSKGLPFGINILECSQSEIAELCSGKVKGEARFEVWSWVEGSLGVPCLADAQAHIVCQNVRSIAHGTHSIFIGQVVDVDIHGLAAPLVYCDGLYGKVLPIVPGTADTLA